MNELPLMKVITGLCVTAVLFIYVFPRLNIRFTKDSFKGFKSFDEFFGYFIFSLNFIKKNRFVFIFPLLFIVISSAIQLALYLNTFFKQNLSSYKQSENINYDYISLDYLVFSIDHLDFGFNGFGLVFTYPLILAALTFGIIYILFYNKLKKITHGYDKIIKIFLSVVYIFVLSFLWIVFLLDHDLNRFAFIKAVNYVIVYIAYMFDSIVQIISKTILELVVLVYLLSKINNLKVDLKNQQFLQQTLSVILPLFVINTIMELPFVISTGLISVQSIGQFSDGNTYFYSFINAVLIVINYLDYVWKIFFILIFLAPFIIIHKNKNFVTAIQQSLDFVISHFFRYMCFIFVGIILMYLSLLLYELPVDLIGRYSIYDPFIQFVTTIIRLFLAVIFYIALFKFYIDSEKQSSQKSVI